MQKISYGLIVLWMLLLPVSPATAQAQIGVGASFSNYSLGINLMMYPDLIPVPGYPVYYAPQLDSNFFFYDGMYWVFRDDDWYVSDWYNGPWWLVDPEDVPLFILRIPVRYYQQPPLYFRGWRPTAPPRWGEHWGREWEQHRRGWNRWNRGAVPAPAPLPEFQREYSGDRYPQQIEQQRELQGQRYHYQPHDPVVRQRVQQGVRQATPETKGSTRQDIQHVVPQQQEPHSAPRMPAPQREGGKQLTPALPQQGQQQTQDHKQSAQPEQAQHEQRRQRIEKRDESQRDKDGAREQDRRQEQGRDRERRD